MPSMSLARLTKVLIFAFFMFLLFSCGGTEQPKNTQANKAEQSAENTMPPGFGNTQVAQTSNQTDQANSESNPQLDWLQQRDEMKRRIASQAQNVPTEPIDPSKMNKTILPDGSEYYAVLDAKGVTETRVFKNNPDLEKIEKFTQGRNVTIKAYLKNGKVIQIAPNKIRDFAQEPADQILIAAGVKSPPPPQKDEKTKEERLRKEEQMKEKGKAGTD